jgi:hypothetical protein
VRRRTPHIGLVVAGLLLGSASWIAPAAGQSVGEDQLKAVYLFNFAKFVDWPAELFPTPDSPMNFCVLGRSPASDELDSSIRGKAINTHTILVWHLHGAEDIKKIKDCHLVFLAASAGKQQLKLLQAAKGSPMLLVSETPGFARAGGSIDFLLENGKLVFEVNMGAAEAVHLKISSKLLVLARIVSSTDERPGQ